MIFTMLISDLTFAGVGFGGFPLQASYYYYYNYYFRNLPS